MGMKTPTYIAALSAVLLAAGGAGTQAQSVGQVLQNAVNDWNGNNNARSSPDGQFLVEAADRTMTTVREGRMARRNAGNSEVRDWADRAVRHDQRLYDRLSEMAQRRGLNLPGGPDENQRDELDRLSDSSGHRFDRRFAEEAVQGQDRLVHLFEREAREGQDMEVRDFAQRSLSDLHEQLDRARDLGRDLDRGGDRD
jgi:putative membrane protein